MTKKKDIQPIEDDQPIWDEKHIKKVKAWLKSEQGINKIKGISFSYSSLRESFNQAESIAPEILREPFTI